MTIFLLVLGISMLMFSYVGTQVRSDQEEDFMHIVAITTADLLIKTPGLPDDWNETNVKSLGLANGDLLNQTKVVNFVNMSYSTAKAGMKISQYEILVTFNDINNTVLNLSGMNMTFGISPESEAQVVKIQRSALISDGENRKATVMNLVLWRRL
jgi:hypothetical protein